ncbi:MAG: hypothetical protein ACOC2R_01360 [Spirochaetota bacterium]
MDRDQLYKLVDLILNHATEDELDVLQAAIDRRSGEEEGAQGSGGAFQFSAKKMAEESAHTIADQVSYSKDTIRNMIKNFAVDIIRQNAPELSDEQVRELLEAWIPDPHSSSAKRQADKRAQEGSIPSDMLIAMIEQFIAYSEGRLPVRQQAQLRREMGEWQDTYWKWFPPEIRDAIALYLKGTIDKETFWLDVHKSLE